MLVETGAGGGKKSLKMIEPDVELRMLEHQDLHLGVKASWLSRGMSGLLGLDCAVPYLDILGYC